MILIKNLFFKYVREYYTLYDINMEIDKNASVAFVGDKDSGKTTLLRILAKLEKFSQGEIYIKDMPLKKINYSCDVNLAYIPKQPIFFNDKTVYENFKYILKVQGVHKNEIEKKINNLLIEFNLEALKDVKINTLSFYEKYLVSIARACFRELDIILIDDILDNVEQEERDKLTELIIKKFKNKTTLIVATENKKFVETICDKQINFKSGSIVRIKDDGEI